MDFDISKYIGIRTADMYFPMIITLLKMQLVKCRFLCKQKLCPFANMQLCSRFNFSLPSYRLPVAALYHIAFFILCLYIIGNAVLPDVHLLCASISID